MFNCHGKQIWACVFVFLASALLLDLTWSPQSQTARIWSKFRPNTNTSTPYTAVILYLVSVSRISELLESFASLNANLPGHPWPVVLFHTGDFDEQNTRLELLTQVRAHLGAENGSDLFTSRIEFVKLNWTLPEGISSDIKLVDPVYPQVWPGYHHMCAFFTATIFDHPRLQDVTYYMRMDTDSLITEPLCYDPFEVMHIRHRSYGYRSVGFDSDQVTVGMWDLFTNYAFTHPSVAEQLRQNKWEWPHRNAEGVMEWLGVTGYHNNFEIVKLEAFRRPDVVAWLDELMSDPERAYKWRWGDAPLRYATVQMFFDTQKDTEQFCGMRYFHPYNPDVDCPCIPP